MKDSAFLILLSLFVGYCAGCVLGAIIAQVFSL